MIRQSQDSRSSGFTTFDNLRWEAYEEVCALLQNARWETCDLVARGSNYTFLAKLVLDSNTPALGIYKPRKGEVPLWDFPGGTLYKREYAAYLLSEALKWHFIPPTAIWEGPHGVGTLQLFIDFDPKSHYFTLRETHPEELKRIAIFDLLTNNADRKGGHCLKDAHGQIWSIDHGLTFHTDYKLRTVIWDFAGEPMPRKMLDDVNRERKQFYESKGLAPKLKTMLNRMEIDVLARRMEAVMEAAIFPRPLSRWDIPYPFL